MEFQNLLQKSLKGQVLLTPSDEVPVLNLTLLSIADVEVKLHGSSASRFALCDSDVNLSISVLDKTVSEQHTRIYNDSAFMLV